MKDFIESNSSPEKIVANLSEANSSYFWVPLKYSKKILCRRMTGASGFPSIVNAYDLSRLRELTKKPIVYREIRVLYLRQNEFNFDARATLTLILVPSYAQFRIEYGQERKYEIIDGKHTSVLAIGDDTPLTISIWRPSSAELTIIEC
jgi:hypothetical protein